MKKLTTSILAAFLLASHLKSQNPNFHYEKVQNGYLNGQPVCGLWEPYLLYNCYAPAFLDWDGDGLKDLFFGLSSPGAIAYYKNTGTAEHPCFTLITNNFGGISVPYGYAAPFPCDLNDDGIIDFIVGNGISASVGGTLHYFRGTGTIDNPTFELETSMLAGIDLSDATVPFLFDVDNDGDIDLFIGEGLGGLYFRENTGTPQVPAWNSPTQFIADLGWRTAIQVLNIKGDSKLEMIAAEAYGSLRLFNNISTNPDTAIWQMVPGNFAGIDACANAGGCLVRPAFVDIDNNGTYDLFIRSEGKFYFYRNVGTVADCAFELEAGNFAPLPDFNYALFFNDKDSDGMMEEMYMPTNDGKVTKYVIGSSSLEPNWVFETADFLNFTTTYVKSLAFGDVNGDGLPDVMVGHNSNPMFNPKLMLFLNTGSGFIYQQVPFLENYPYGQRAIPEMGDLDNDGLMDLIVATGGSSPVHFECTDTSGINWQEVPNSLSPFPDNLCYSGVCPYKVTIGDVDGDGDLDMFAGNPLRYFENVGDANNPEFVLRNWSFQGVPSSTYTTLGNVTDDCGLELFVGQQFFKYKGVQPEIQSIATGICSNDDPVQIMAQPEAGTWFGADSLGWFNPNVPPGYYPVVYQYEDAQGCYPRYDTIWMNVHLAPDATLALINNAPIVEDTIPVCSGAGIQTLVPVQPGGIFTGLNMSQGQFNPATWGIGFHMVTNRVTQNGCTDRDTLIIEITQPPTATIAGENVICLGESNVLSASDGNSFLWSTGETSASITVSPATSTTYTVSVSDGNGCTDAESITVSVFSEPVAFISGDDEICKGSTSTLTASGGISFSWNTSATSPTIAVSPDTSTTYTVTVTDINGCTDKESMTITVNPLPIVAISGDDLICIGESTILTASGGEEFLWNTGATTAAITVSSVETTLFSVTVTDGNDCTGTENWTVSVGQMPDATIAAINAIPITNDTVFVCHDAGFQTLIPFQPGGEFSGITFNGQFDPLALGLGVYTVTYTIAENGCTNSDTLIIVIQDCATNASTEKRKTAFQLAVNPNPFSSSITFEFILPVAGMIELTIADLNGKNVKRLVQEVFPIGKHVFSFNELHQLKSGTYLATLWVNGKSVSRLVVKE